MCTNGGSRRWKTGSMISLRHSSGTRPDPRGQSQVTLGGGFGFMAAGTLNMKPTWSRINYVF